MYSTDDGCLEQMMPPTQPGKSTKQTAAQPCHFLGKHPAGLSGKEVRQFPAAGGWPSAAPPPLNTLGADFLPGAHRGRLSQRLWVGDLQSSFP